MIRRNALIDELKRVSEIAGQSPTEQDMLEYGDYAYSTYFRYFESWTKAKEIAGVDDPSENKISDEELIDELQRVNELVEKSPTRREVDRLGEYPSSTYKYRFGSWNDALQAADLPINQSSFEEGSPSYGPNWEPRRKEILQRDSYRCRICQRSPETVSGPLHVHHIKPLREFEQEDGAVNFEAAHDADNLITLCPACHISYEGHFKRCAPNEFVEKVRKSNTRL